MRWGWKGCEGLATQSAQSSLQSFPPFRVFKTPGLRSPASKEQVYNISINGSPLTHSKEISLSVPIGGGAVSGALESQATVFCPVKPLISLSCLPMPASETPKRPSEGGFPQRVPAHPGSRPICPSLPFAVLMQHPVCGVRSEGH